MNKPPRSNSDENVSLNPFSKIIHSKPTSHGSGQRSFGAKDDASSMVSPNQYIVSSPYHSASSALAVS
jgi:hypothetical protein